MLREQPDHKEGLLFILIWDHATGVVQERVVAQAPLGPTGPLASKARQAARGRRVFLDKYLPVSVSCRTLAMHLLVTCVWSKSLSLWQPTTLNGCTQLWHCLQPFFVVLYLLNSILHGHAKHVGFHERSFYLQALTRTWVAQSQARPASTERLAPQARPLELRLAGFCQTHALW